MTELRYLLDTNIVSDLVRNPLGRVSRQIREVGQSTACTSIIVACELRFGATKNPSSRITDHVHRILGTITVLPFDGDVDTHYGRVRALLERMGQTIGNNDYLIAAHALSLDLTLVTHNMREFSRVPGLQVEDWLS